MNKILLVKNLSSKTTAFEVAKIFDTNLPTNVVVINTKNRHAYVEFENESHANAAFKLNSTTLNGKEIEIDFAIGGMKKSGTTSDRQLQWSRVVVDIAFEVENGLSGMKRDIVLHLCQVMNLKGDQVVRVLIGMCQEHVRWKSADIFKSALFQTGRINDTFIGPASPDGLFKRTMMGEKSCVFTAAKPVVFLETPIHSKGVWQWNTQITHGGRKGNMMCIGFSPALIISDYLREKPRFFGSLYGLRFGPERSHMLNVYAPRRMREGDVLPITPGVASGSVVMLECDTEKMTLSFFIDGAKIATGVSLVPHQIPLHFGMAGDPKSSFTSLSFRMVPSPTESSMECLYFN